MVLLVCNVSAEIKNNLPFIKDVDQTELPYIVSSQDGVINNYINNTYNNITILNGTIGNETFNSIYNHTGGEVVQINQNPLIWNVSGDSTGADGRWFEIQYNGDTRLRVGRAQLGLIYDGVESRAWRPMINDVYDLGYNSAGDLFRWSDIWLSGKIGSGDNAPNDNFINFDNDKITINDNYTLPYRDGAPNQLLSTYGNGSLYWKSEVIGEEDYGLNMTVGFFNGTNNLEGKKSFMFNKNSDNLILNGTLNFSNYITKGTTTSAIALIQLSNKTCCSTESGGAPYKSGFNSVGGEFFNLLATATGTSIFSGSVEGDSYRRFRIRADGGHVWGDGAKPIDVMLSRIGVNTLGLQNDTTGAGNPANLKVYDGGYIGFGDSSDTRLFYDGTNFILNTSKIGSGIAIFSDNVSATGYITRTSIYDKSSGKALDLIKDAESYVKEGKINHSAFYGFVSYPITDYSRPQIVEYQYDDCNDKICVKKSGTKIEYPYKVMSEGVSLDKEIDVLRQAVYELKVERQKYESCLISSTDFKTYKECLAK